MHLPPILANNLLLQPQQAIQAQVHQNPDTPPLSPAHIHRYQKSLQIPMHLPPILVTNPLLQLLQLSQVQGHQNPDSPPLSPAHIRRNQTNPQICLPLFLPYLRNYPVLSQQVLSIKALSLAAFFLTFLHLSQMNKKSSFSRKGKCATRRSA